MFAIIGKNRFKTALIVTLIFAFLCAVIYFVSYALGIDPYSAAMFAIGFSMLTSIGSYWFSDKIVLRLSNAHPATPEQERYLTDILGRLVTAAGITMPRLYVMHDSSPNAFATGRNHKNGVICVTTGLLESLDYNQTEGVLAHELAHIKNCDILLQTVASVMIGAAIMMANMFSRSMIYGSRGRRSSSRGGKGQIVVVLVGLFFAILAPIAGQLLRLSLSRNREYLADATAIEFTRDPEGLASALEKISGSRIPLQNVNTAMEGMYIASPSTIKNLFSTHPPIEKRVSAIRNMR